MNRKRFKLLAAAYHEAGHAAIAITSRIEFEWIAVFRSVIRGQPWDGKFRLKPSDRPDTSRSAQVDIAGMVSEARFTAVIQLGPAVRFASDAPSLVADQIAAIPDKRDRKQTFTVPIAVDGGMKSLQVSAYSLSGSDLTGFRRLTKLKGVTPESVLSKAMDLLDDPAQWLMVETIAEALLVKNASGADERRELTSAEIVALLADQ
jgi:hypothetical protein